MKRLIIAVLALFLLVGFNVNADTITLDSGETIDTPTANKLAWFVDRIDNDTKVLAVKWRWLDSAGNSIMDDSGITWKKWYCRDLSDMFPGFNNNDCVDVQDPYECCTGVATGTCDDPETCFTDVFTFEIRTQDVGTPIGIGLRTLIWNQMKTDVLSGGNDGTFD